MTSKTETGRVRKIVVTVLRAALGVALAAGLIYLTLRSTGTDLWSELHGSGKLLLGLALVMHGVMLVLATWRWWLLLRVQSINIPIREVARLTMIGFFFNLAVPGAVGGDLIKMGFVGRQASGKGAEAVFSIVMDRLLGVLGLFLVAGVAGWLLLEFHRVLLDLPALTGLWRLLERKSPKRLAETVTRLVSAVDHYRRSRRTLVVAILISVAIHSCLAFDLYLVGRSLGDRDLSLRNYFVTAQVANAIASVPVTPGGVGLRDKGAQEFFVAFGMAREKAGAIPVTLTLVILAWGMVGAAVFVLAPPASVNAAGRRHTSSSQAR